MVLSRQKNWAQGTKVWVVNSPSHGCDLVGCYLSSCFGRGSGVVIWRVAHPEQSVLLGVDSVSCHEDVVHHFCSSLIPRWLQGDCRENG
jgi:hypothetical protein